MRDDDVILRCEDLVRMFGDGDSQTTAVDGVSMELHRGEFGRSAIDDACYAAHTLL